MLSYKISEILLASGKKYPAKWLMNYCSFGKTKAFKIANKQVQSITLRDLTKICEGLRCTPNDLMYWENTPALTLPPDHPLAQLGAPSKKSDWYKLLNSMEPTKAMVLHGKIESGEV